MSTAWKPPVVLFKEPWKAVGSRVFGRALIPVITLWLSGIPGTAWTGVIEWIGLRIPVFIIAVGAVLLWLLAILNVFVNRRVVLRCMPTGSIERPRSLQERWLKIHQEYAIGKRIAVTPEHAQFMSQSEPRVNLSAEGTVRRVPLHGTSAEDFVAASNALLKGRGITFVLMQPEGPPGPGDPIDDAES